MLPIGAHRKPTLKTITSVGTSVFPDTATWLGNCLDGYQTKVQWSFVRAAGDQAISSFRLSRPVSWTQTSWDKLRVTIARLTLLSFFFFFLNLHGHRISTSSGWPRISVAQGSHDLLTVHCLSFPNARIIGVNHYA